MKKELYNAVRDKALEMYEKAHILLTPAEKEGLEVADFGLGEVWKTGLEIVTYVNTERCCAKEMVLFPGQTLPRAPARAGRTAELSGQGGNLPLPVRAGVLICGRGSGRESPGAAT